MVAGAWDETREAPRERYLVALLREAAAAQQGRTFLWAPVALSFGIWGYFGLGREPSWIALGPLALAGLGLLWAARARPVVALAAFAILGCVLAKGKADWVAAPTLHATTAQRTVTGMVEDRSPSGSGRQTIILDVESIAGMTADNLPRRLRLSATLKQGGLAIGDHVSVQALLGPLPGPVLPGGFDYGRDLWFQGIGGTGRLAGTISPLPAEDMPRLLAFSAAMENLRQLIGIRIRQTLDGVTAAIGEAIITGERSSIPREVNLSFQISGLAHVLSISGLHMVLAAGGVFWLMRAVLAMIPALALRWPIKKWAAGVALAAGLFYMLLAGSQVATQRSYIMIAIVFFAIIVDRPAISVRNLALAGVIILGLEPEAATQASFQMSFMAVMGLTAYYEFWSAWKRSRAGEPRVSRHWAMAFALKLAAGLAAAMITTIVAGGMSSIPAAFHFGRLSPYSLVANGLALPVISFVIMPMALLSMLAMPFGLEHWPLWAMGKGIDLMMAISDWVASFPGARMIVAQEGALAAIVTAAGAAVLCLLRGPLRLAGAAVMIAGMVLGSTHPFPDLLVQAKGSAVAFRDEDGLLVPAPGGKDRFALEKWLTANGEEASAAEANQRPGWVCDDHVCIAQVKDKTVAYLHEKPGEIPDCGGFDIVIADFPLRRACPGVALRIDRFDLWRNGAQAVSIAAGEASVSTARGVAGERPWVLVRERRSDPFKRP